MQVFSTTREFRRSAFFEALRRAGMIVLPRAIVDSSAAELKAAQDLQDHDHTKMAEQIENALERWER